MWKIFRKKNIFRHVLRFPSGLNVLSYKLNVFSAEREDIEFYVHFYFTKFYITQRHTWSHQTIKEGVKLIIYLCGISRRKLTNNAFSNRY